jgi:hypothetical protein
MISGVLIDEVNNGAEKNGESFTAAGRGIYQAAFAIYNMLPGCKLEAEWLFFVGCKPINDD